MMLCTIMECHCNVQCLLLHYISEVGNEERPPQLIFKTHVRQLLAGNTVFCITQPFYQRWASNLASSPQFLKMKSDIQILACSPSSMTSADKSTFETTHTRSLPLETATVIIQKNNNLELTYQNQKSIILSKYTDTSNIIFLFVSGFRSIGMSHILS